MTAQASAHSMQQVRRQLSVIEGGAVREVSASLRVGFASSDWVHVDQHFGTSVGFVAYAVSDTESRLLRAAEFVHPQTDDDEGHLEPRLDWAADCDVVYCQAVGSAALRALGELDVRAVRVQGAATIEGLIRSLRKEQRRDV